MERQPNLLRQMGQRLRQHAGCRAGVSGLHRGAPKITVVLSDTRTMKFLPITGGESFEGLHSTKPEQASGR